MDHMVNILLAVCEILKPVPKLLKDSISIKSKDLKASKPALGDILITKVGKGFIFTVVMKNPLFDKINHQILIRSLRNLQIALIKHGLYNFCVAKKGNELDNLNIKLYLMKELSDCPDTITLCKGNIEVPTEDKWDEMIKEAHCTLVGGHKEEVKIYIKQTIQSFSRNRAHQLGKYRFEKNAIKVIE